MNAKYFLITKIRRSIGKTIMKTILLHNNLKITFLTQTHHHNFSSFKVAIISHCGYPILTNHSSSHFCSE